MNIGYIKGMAYLAKEKQEQQKIKDLQGILRELITMDEHNPKQVQHNIEIYTCYETRLFNRHYGNKNNAPFKKQIELQQEAYYKAKRFLSYENYKADKGIQAGA